MPSRSRSRSRAKVVRRFKRARLAGLPRLRSSGVYLRSRTWASKSLNTHRFSRYAGTSAFPNITVEATQESVNHVFALADVVNAVEFRELFDQYKIEKVIVTYQLVSNPNANNALNATTTASTNWFPIVWSVPDYDDTASLNIDEMKERIGVKCRVLKPDKMLKFVVRPKVNVQTYRTALTTGYAPKRMFVDMTTQDIPHYGLKTCIDCQGIDPNDTYPFVIRQTRQYFFTCTNVR